MPADGPFYAMMGARSQAQQAVQGAINSWTTRRDQDLKKGYSATTGLKFNDAAAGRSFEALLGKNLLDAGQYYGKDGEFAVVKSGSQYVPSGYTSVGSVSPALHYKQYKDNPRYTGPTWGGIEPRYVSNSSLPKNLATNQELQIVRRTTPVISAAAPQAAPSASLAASQAVSTAQQDLNAARTRAQDWLKKSGSTGTTARKFTGKFIDDANTMAASAADLRQRLDNDAAVWAAEGKLELAEKSKAFGDFLATAKIKAPEYKDPLTTPVKIDPNSIFAQQLEMLKGFDKA